jgi:isoquinoline 1-oxidoreductase beta subunit
MTIALSRRAFIQASLSAAGGLAIAAFAPEFAGATTVAGEPWSPETSKAPDEVNAFVVIDPDNSITLRVAKSDMGQGVLTSMAMILAEELECDFAKVKVEYASAHRNLVDGNVYQSMGTGGSRSVRGSRAFLQQAGASARERLIAAAAARWAVEPAACVASSGHVRHDASGRSATFGELTADAAKVTLAAEPAIKTPDQFKLIGQGLKRIDTPLKVTGEARFGIDARLPGMAYAAVANCPVFGGKLKSYDFSAISARRGIIAALPVTKGVAVVADNFWRARSAARDAGRMGLRPGRRHRQRRVRRRIPRRARRAACRRRRPWGCRQSLRPAGQTGRGALRGSASRARADGAAQRDRALARRPH